MRGRLLFAFIAVLCLPALAAAQDNNDSFATADQISFGQTVSGAIDPDGDEDYCQMQVPTAGVIEAVLSDIPNDKSYVITLFNDDPAEVEYTVTLTLFNACGPAVVQENVDLAIVTAPETQVDEYSLYQNAPNPAQQRTRVKFSLPSPQRATLEIIDSHGRIVAQYEQSFPAGFSEVVVPTRQLPAGWCQYRLRTPEFTGIRSMIVE